MKKYIGALIGVTGLALVFYWYDWRLALILILMLWGNNIERKYS